MTEIEIIKSKEKLTITWKSAIINISLKDIVEVNTNNTITNTTKVVKVGRELEFSEMVVIRTKKLVYELFTTNKLTLLNKINF
ncbi:SunI/YnzG family protein [Bacillus cereus]|uniref:SunI/YnzG family protein n=1 Tax=Bacillus cereus TaxID=1396 RepID=UPI003640B620